MKRFINRVFFIVLLLAASQACRKPEEVSIPNYCGEEHALLCFTDSIKNTLDILTNFQMSLESRLQKTGQYKPEVKTLIEELIKAAKSGEFAGGGSGPSEIPNDTEFDTGKTLNGQTIYGYRQSTTLLTAGSIFQIPNIPPVAEIFTASANSLNGFFNNPGGVDVFINSGAIILRNNTGADASVVAYVEYTKQ